MTIKTEYRDQFQSREAAASYDAQYAQGGYAGLLDQVEKEILRERIVTIRRTHPGIDMLDFACGTGRITAFLEALVDRSVGLDISPSMLERARMNTARTEFVCGDLTTDPALCPGPFDLIVTFRFVTNAGPQLREAALLRLRDRFRGKDSRLIFNVHRSIHSYLVLHWVMQKLKRTAPDHDWHYMSIPEAHRLARRCGFEIESLTGFGFLSSHIAGRLPSQLALKIERLMSRIPGFNWFGSEFIAVCRPV
ncbi:MAG: class I SAM-dependent methyltransferase [Anaerolineales bacterium]|nr:class I SAM-dependent methyltransferase [Anaerolineales bacterium]